LATWKEVAKAFRSSSGARALCHINMGQPIFGKKGTGTRMPGEIEQTPSGRRRNRPATALCTGDIFPPQASGIHSGILRTASSYDNCCIQPFVPSDSPLVSWKNSALRKIRSCARTYALAAQSIGTCRHISVSVLTRLCDVDALARAALMTVREGAPTRSGWQDWSGRQIWKGPTERVK
jgi:hypothetical protein